MSTGSVIRTCGVCNVEFRVQLNVVQKGKGRFCSPPCSMKGRRVVITTPQRTSITPKAADRVVLDGWADSGLVLCAGCRQPRPRGTFCKTCEWRAFQQEAS